ncbi:MAG: helix-turn-helix domain-containing protein [Magnetococcales bacterium]|nr:helix-turn-helix domain-containing protein [Magnetococcales bacterium]
MDNIIKKDRKNADFGRDVSTGIRLRWARERRGWSQRILAVLWRKPPYYLPSSQRIISEWERKEIPAKKVSMVAAFFGVARDLFYIKLSKTNFNNAVDAADPLFDPKKTKQELAESQAKIRNINEELQIYKKQDPDAVSLRREILGAISVKDYNRAHYLSKKRENATEMLFGEKGIGKKIERCMADAKLEINSGNYIGATAIYKKTINEVEVLVGKNHFQIGLLLLGLAATNMAFCEYQEATSNFERALEIFHSTVGPNSEISKMAICSYEEAKKLLSNI